MEELPQEKIWAIYETLPNSIKAVAFSIDTADAIMNVAKLNDIENTQPIVKVVTYTLFGLLPPDLLAETLQEESGIKADKSKKIALELEHFIFNAVKPELDKLYNTETKTEEVAEQPKGDDTYREPLA